MRALTKIFITVSVGIILTLIVMFLINFTLTRVNEAGVSLSKMKTEHATLDQQIRAFKVAQSDLAKADKKDKILKAIVSREELVNAVVSIERAVASTGSTHVLKISEEPVVVTTSKNKTVPVEVITNKSGLEEVSYRLSFTNDYLGAINLLGYLEHLPQFTEVTKINLAAEAGERTGDIVPVHTGKVFGNIEAIFLVKKNEVPSQTK